MTAARPADDGFSLIEVVIAIALLGIGVTAVLSGILTSIVTSDVHRKQATGESVVRGYAEAVKAKATADFAACAAPDTYKPDTFNPDGYDVTVTAVDFWNPAAKTWQPTCTSAPAQRLTVRAASGDGRSVETVQLVVRKRGL